MAQSIASTTPASLTSCTKRRLSQTLSSTKWSLRGLVLTTGVLWRVSILKKGATGCDVYTAPSRRVSAKLHLSQLVDTSMLHDERCTAEFRKRLSTSVPLALPWKHKLMTCSAHFAILQSAPSTVLAKYLLHPGFRNARGKLFSRELLPRASG